MVRIALAAVSVLLLAYLAGRRRGRAAERVAVNRYLHDSVLPTLDALALGAPPDAARAQAAELRRGMGGPVAPRPLAAELAAVVADLARHGLRTHLELADDGVGLPARRRAALRDATREALRNTVKHAGTDRAEVRVERHGDGVAVITRDHGVGYDQSECDPGFGIAQSIVARMAEVGGHADVESRPGWGTRVRLWVPR
jgi:signal transduction histidine kinase